jgi:chemotaxis protein MotA
MGAREASDLLPAVDVAPAAPARRAGDGLGLAGLLVGVAAILGGQALEGGTLGSLTQTAAFVIVFGGTFGAVMLQSPRQTFIEAGLLARWIVIAPRRDCEATIAEIGRWSRVARRDGTLAIERRIDDDVEPFLRQGLQLLVDGFEPERIRTTLEIEIDAWDDRRRRAARVWEAAGGYAPTVGILGAVIGLIQVLGNLSDPSRLGSGIAVAFVATVYGVGSANLLFLPIAGKLKALIEAEVAHREMIVDGVVGIALGENPKVIEARLAAYLA